MMVDIAGEKYTRPSTNTRSSMNSTISTLTTGGITHEGLINGTEVCLKFPNNLLVLSQASSLLIGALSGYTMVSLILHHTLSRKRGGNSGSGSQKFSGANPEYERRARFYKKMMNIHMILGSCWITVRCMLDFAVLRTGHLYNPNYVTYSMIEILLNIAALSSMYFVLWLRLWSFYSHPVMEDAQFGKLRLVCLSLLAIMIATGLWNAIAFLTERDKAFTLGENGCIFTNSSTMYKFYVLGACTLFYQFVFLGLFAYPLILHARKNIIAASSKKKSIMRVLRRVFIAAVMCSVTDLVTSIVSVILEGIYPESSFLVYNINIFANLISLMYSFGDWKTRLLFPFMLCRRTAPPVWNSSTVHSNIVPDNKPSLNAYQFSLVTKEWNSLIP